MARPAGSLFTIALGLAGWAVVIGLPRAGVLAQSSATPVVWIALFVVVILAARALAVRVLAGSVLALDSAYYVAATLCVGTVDASRIVGIALTIDAAVRLVQARRRSAEVSDGWTHLGYVLYFGG
ncbi:MAG TPA: hypothetical protein VGC42_01555, partial [Kofleriaceae bacterium]